MIFPGQASFRGSFYEIAQLPNISLPQVAFVGRSNVGKSSMINKLLNRRNLAKTSKAPGKTRSINFYEIGGKYLFVDLPGYGYARLAASDRKAWKELIEYYFRQTRSLKGIIHLIDIRHGLQDSDRELINYIDQLGIKMIRVLTKSDKLNRKQQAAVAENIGRELDIDSRNLVIFSARDNTGVKELSRKIMELLES